MNNQSKKEEYSLSWIELRRCSEMGIIKNMRLLFQSHNFPIEAVDISLRKCINKFDLNKKNYCDCLIELLRHCDINYVNPKFENSNLIMCACGKGEKFIIQQIWDPNLNKGEIDLTHSDKNKSNCFHYLLYKNIIEEDAIEIMQLLLEYNKHSKIHKISNEDWLEQADHKENTVLNLILLKGFSKMLSLYYDYTKYKKHVKSDKNTNLIHCAVMGKSLGCLKVMLNYCTIEDLKYKNKEGLTPQLFANKSKYYFAGKIIEAFETNFNNNTLKNLILTSPVESTEILAAYHNKNYEHVLNWLKQYKLNQSIIGDIKNWSYEWNYVWSKRVFAIIKGISSEQIQNHFKNDKESKGKSKKNIPSTTLHELSKFFTKSFNNDNYISSHNDGESYAIDIVIYNRIIFYLKIWNIPEVYKLIYWYLKCIHPQNPLHYVKFLTYCNVTILLIEVFIKNDWIDLSRLLCESYGSFWVQNYKKNKQLYNRKEVHKNVLDFLNDHEIWNPFSVSWDEHFCYLNILKALTSGDNSKKYLNDYKSRASKCKYSSDWKIFTRLNALYLMVKTKKNYNYGNYLKCYSKLDCIRRGLNTEQKEIKLFYYNSWGILALKMKNYLHAEHLFRIGIRLFKDEYNSGNYGRHTMWTSIENDEMSIPFFNYLCYMKYNLALSLFYQKRYFEANDLLSKLCEIKILNNNIFIWYRLGLTYLEMYRSKNKEWFENESELLKKTVGFVHLEKGNTRTNDDDGEDCDDCDDDDNKDIYEELFKEFEKEFGHEMQVNPFNMLNKGRSNNNNNKKLQDNSIWHMKSKHLRHCIFLNTGRGKSKTILKSNTEDHDGHLKKAINAFRSSLSLSTNNINTTTSKTITQIYQIYSKNDPNSNNIPNESKKENSSEKESAQLKRWFHRQMNQNIIMSCKLNLLFCLSWANKWGEILYWTSKILKQEWSVDLIVKINYYKIEALLALKRCNEAKVIIWDWCTKYQNEKINLDAYHKWTMNKVTSFNYNIGLTCGLAWILCKERKYVEAENKIKFIIDNYYKGKEQEIPLYIINILLFVLLSFGEEGKSRALKIIKTRNLRSVFVGIDNKT